MTFSKEMEEMIDFINMYWKQIVFCMLMIFVMVYGCMTGKCIEWLKGAVTEAEKYLGSGTGQLKLRIVYDAFIDKFPGFSAIVPFKLFSYWVDIALKWLAKQMESNVNVKTYINGE